MSDTQLQKRDGGGLKDRGQYLVAFGVVASMLWVAQFPIFVIFFFGIFAYFLLRMFSSGSRSETREIFEFYLTANEMLRDDERRWYGFELNEVIRRGEDIVRRMKSAPPLVHFTLGALQNRVGNHKAAITNLTYVVENSSSDEKSFLSPSPELQSYVRVLRKIEREPTEAPLTSAAVRALERARKLRAKTLLEESRQQFAAIPVVVEPLKALEPVEADGHGYESAGATMRDASFSVVDDGTAEVDQSGSVTSSNSNGASEKHSKRDPFVDRQSISEVLHDIYDKNVQ
ncbi:MAG TPA: hypothetical protein VMZ26_01355 [Pyrinomonadaceae bacterium]|nr:hypothetical protein [Pyrinomonadaceae bacterium]